MALIILGTEKRPQVVDTDAIKIVEVITRGRTGSQVVVRNERGTELGVWTPPPRSGEVKNDDVKKTELAQQKLREITAIVREAKPKTQREVHNFSNFVLEPEIEPLPPPPASEPTTEAAEATEEATE